MIKHSHLLRKKPEERNINPGLPKGFKIHQKKKKLYKYYLNIPTIFNETNYKKYKNKLIIITERYQYHKEFHKHRGNL